MSTNIPSCPTTSHHLPQYPIMSANIPSCLTTSHYVPQHPIMSTNIRSCPTTSHHVPLTSHQVAQQPITPSSKRPHHGSNYLLTRGLFLTFYSPNKIQVERKTFPISCSEAADFDGRNVRNEILFADRKKPLPSKYYVSVSFIIKIDNSVMNLLYELL
ncbi:hypothetical protein LSH36_72g02016 [Paralvinella palmiformis]|uniref:Uncharacterized protein n=1 Tax=Paralvinella palmiformis TaxID=53620 RepID=A0AAD9NBG6_9ANNE|nr:hypothetical protein LSH36_72g02016 [Paralvinella palmiformis]